MNRGWFFIVPLFLLLVAGNYSCSNCNNCGPSSNYPYVNVRFYNIDSLVKIDDSITVLNDSISTITNLIKQGADSLSSVLNSLNNNLSTMTAIQAVINSAKIKIDSVEGVGSDNFLYFTDSVTHDSLTSFHFPLKMTEGNSEFIIAISGRKDTLSLNYNLISQAYGANIISRAYDLSVEESTYDSIKMICKKDSCFSNDVTLNIYF